MTQELSTKVLTLPNVISFARILMVPVFAWLMFSRHDLAAVVLLVLAGGSDWLDGILARRLNQMSVLGQMIDPVADRLYIFVTLVGLAYRSFIPWWLVAVIVARELVLVGCHLLLTSRGIGSLQVHMAGKAATFALMYAFPLLLLGAMPGVWGYGALVIGWAAALWGVALYWISAWVYVRQTAGALAGRSHA